MRETPFILTVTVWGRSYIEKFIRFALPTFLAPGNIPGLVKERKAEFLIVTSPAGKMIIEELKIYSMLSAFLKVKFVILDFDDMAKSSDERSSYPNGAANNALGRETSMSLMSLGHRTACDYAASRNGFCVFLGPDFLLSDGSLTYLDRRAAAGIWAVLLPGFRLIEEEARKTIINYYIDTIDHAIVIPPRRLVRMIFNHVHPEMKSYMVDSKDFSYCPNYVVWPLRSQDTLLVHAFHLHPLLVDVSRAENFSTLARDTIDGDFVGRIIEDWEEIEIVRDSDDATVVSLTPKLAGPGIAAGAIPDPDTVSRWAYGPVMTPLHRYCFTKIILLHAGPTPEVGDLPLAETGRFVYDTLRTRVVPLTFRALAKSLRDLANRHTWQTVRRGANALQYTAMMPVRMVRHGVRVGQLLERLDDEIGGLVAENRALHERLAAATSGEIFPDNLQPNAEKVRQPDEAAPLPEKA